MHAILEDNAADSDPNCLTEGAEETEHCDGDRKVFRRCGSLHGEADGGEEDTESESRDKVQEDPARDTGVEVDDAEDTHAESRDGPAEPDRPAVSAAPGYENTGDHGAGGDGECFGEEGNSRYDGTVFFHGLVVEWHVVEGTPEDEALEDCADEGDDCGAILEDCRWDDRVRSNVIFVGSECNQSHCTDYEWNEGAPGVPVVHDAAPGQGDQERSGATDEEHCSGIVDATELLSKRAWDEVEFQEQKNENNSNTDKREIDVEDPPLQKTQLVLVSIKQSCMEFRGKCLPK